MTSLPSPRRKIPLHRLKSDQAAIEALANKNVNWVGPRFYAFYVVCMIFFEWAMQEFFVDIFKVFSPDQGFTTVHCLHGLISFFVMHYISGTPGELGDQGEFYALTWWEQLDDGVAFTASHKVLMSIPIVLFLFTSHITKYEYHHLLVNSLILALVLIPKFPQMHRVRLGSAEED